MLLQTLTHVIVICMLSMREQIYCIYSAQWSRKKQIGFQIFAQKLTIFAEFKFIGMPK